MTMIQQDIRYDLQRNPPYQINYRSKRAGKHITASKRRITFQFGFSSADAIASGQTETSCRGEEHEVILIWSHVSGKRELFMDGTPIHVSKGPRGNTKFQFTWSIGPHVLKIVANFKDQSKNFERQFDLFLDGITFFRFFKIFQLGRTGKNFDNSSNYPRVVPKNYSYRSETYAEDKENNISQKNIPYEVNVKPIDLFDQPSVATLSLVSSGSTLSEDEFCPNSYDSVSNNILSAYNHPPSYARNNLLAPSGNQIRYFGQVAGQSRP